MRATIIRTSNTLVVWQISYTSYSTGVWRIRGGRLTFRNFISKPIGTDVSQYFKDAGDISREEADFFAMVYPGIRVFNVKTGEIYE